MPNPAEIKVEVPATFWATLGQIAWTYRLAIVITAVVLAVAAVARRTLLPKDWSILDAVKARNIEGRTAVIRDLMEANRRHEAVARLTAAIDHDLAMALCEPLHPGFVRQTMDMVVHGVCEVVSTGHRSAVLIPDESGKNLEIMVGHGYHRGDTARICLPIGRNATDAGKAYATGDVVYDQDIRKSDTYARFPRESGYRYLSILDIPIKIAGRCFGVLNLDAEKVSAFSEDDIACAQHFAMKLAVLFLLEIQIASQEEVASVGHPEVP